MPLCLLTFTDGSVFYYNILSHVSIFPRVSILYVTPANMSKVIEGIRSSVGGMHNRLCSIFVPRGTRVINSVYIQWLHAIRRWKQNYSEISL